MTEFAVKNTFYEELRDLLNRHSKENQCDTPDYILASFMEKCLSAFEESVLQRDAWYGHDHWKPGDL